MHDVRAAPVVLGQLGAFPDGLLVPVPVDGRSLLVVRLGADVFVAVNRCPHRGLPLVTDSRPLDDRRGVIRCPWHGSEFDVRTGAALRRCAAAGVPAGRYRTRHQVLRRLGGLERLAALVDDAGQLVVLLPAGQRHVPSGVR